MRTGEKHTKLTDGTTLHRLTVPCSALDNFGDKKCRGHIATFAYFEAKGASNDYKNKHFLSLM
jgi:hypothetical protein